MNWLTPVHLWAPPRCVRDGKTRGVTGLTQASFVGKSAEALYFPDGK